MLFFCTLFKIGAQEDSPFQAYDVPAQNLLKYNRFLINPTFSTVREDKSYVNLLHRNQSVQFDDNRQNYFLSYSGRVSDRTGLGLSLYSQRLGTLSNFGVLANYAYGVKLSDKSNLTLGANVSYYSSGFDEARANTVEQDPFLAGLQDQNLISFQPGLNLSYGKFDVGVFAENLFDYNIKTSESLTGFNEKTFSGHLQYTHQFENESGIFEEGRLMPLARVRKIGEEELTLGGSLILDLPKLGWVQGGYDSFYGAAAGVGFNLNRRISLGYTMEKGLSNNFDNFGVTHEISFAYSFTPNLTEDRVMLEDDFEDDLVENGLEPQNLATNDEIEELKQKLAENDAIIQELIFRQDSLEANRQGDLERRFEMVMRMVRNETNGERPDLEQKAEDLFRGKDPQTAIAANRNSTTPTTLGSNKQGNQADMRLQAKDAVANREPSKEIVGDRVTSKRFKDLPNVTDGYYLVANVYKGGEYMDNFLNTLTDQGIDANYIDNPNNGLKYVYVQRYDSFEQAAAAHASNVDGKYIGPTWIMNVDNRYSNEAYASNVNKLKEKSSKYGRNGSFSNPSVKDGVASSDIDTKPYVIEGAGTGYYLIANVFANPRNANRFVKLLNSLGLSASYFINPKNNYRYVYLKKHGSWTNALISYYSKLNDAYNDKMWIMRINEERMA